MRRGRDGTRAESVGNRPLSTNDDACAATPAAAASDADPMGVPSVRPSVRPQLRKPH